MVQAVEVARIEYRRVVAPEQTLPRGPCAYGGPVPCPSSGSPGGIVARDKSTHLLRYAFERSLQGLFPTNVRVQLGPVIRNLGAQRAHACVHACVRACVRARACMHVHALAREACTRALICGGGAGVHTRALLRCVSIVHCARVTLRKWRRRRRRPRPRPHALRRGDPALVGVAPSSRRGCPLLPLIP